tara:strand:- start:88202 stop:88390 length:189 start_codon:yes stop_codon:yes gene_type:complete
VYREFHFHHVILRKDSFHHSAKRTFSLFHPLHHPLLELLLPYPTTCFQTLHRGQSHNYFAPV